MLMSVKCIRLVMRMHVAEILKGAFPASAMMVIREME